MCNFSLQPHWIPALDAPLFEHHTPPMPRALELIRINVRLGQLKSFRHQRTNPNTLRKLWDAFGEPSLTPLQLSPIQLTISFRSRLSQQGRLCGSVAARRRRGGGRFFCIRSPPMARSAAKAAATGDDGAAFLLLGRATLRRQLSEVGSWSRWRQDKRCSPPASRAERIL